MKMKGKVGEIATFAATGPTFIEDLKLRGCIVSMSLWAGQFGLTYYWLDLAEFELARCMVRRLGNG